MQVDTCMRKPKEVFEDHLKIRKNGHDAIEKDISRNYSDNILIFTSFGIFHGKDGLRKCAAKLRRELPCTDYDYITNLVRGEIAYLEWKVDCGSHYVDDGADTFLIKNGKIVLQTIHYTVKKRR